MVRQGTWRVLDPEGYLDEKSNEARNMIERARQLLEQDRVWRRAVVTELYRIGKPLLGEATNICLRIWRDGRPVFFCQKLRYCLTCLRWKLTRIIRDDQERLAAHSIQHVFVGYSSCNKTSKGTPWRRAVRGSRRLYLPGSRTFLWVIVADDPEPAMRALDTKLRRTSIEQLKNLYLRPIKELVELGPKEAVHRALHERRRVHTHSVSGILKSPRRQKPRHRVAVDVAAPPTN